MKTAPKEGPKKSLRSFFIVLFIIVLLLLIPLFYIFHLLGKTNFDNSKDNEILMNESSHNIQQNTEEDIPKKVYTNFVIFGVDSRNNTLSSGTRSDCIILVNVNHTTKEVKMSSVYRDTYVEIPSHGYTKINHAYAYGGYSLALSTLNTNFDLNFTQYVTVNFYAVTKIVDLIGGIELDIQPNELKWLNGYVREINQVNNTSVAGLTLAGTQKVNGTQALAYARIRYTAGGDFKRAERQRIVVDKIFEKVKSQDLVSLNRIINQMLPEVSTNINSFTILNLAKDVFSYSITKSEGFPYENEIRKIKGVSYVVPKDLRSNVVTLHMNLLEDSSYQPSDTVISISESIDSVLK